MFGESNNKPFRESFINLTKSNALEIIQDIDNKPDEYFQSIPIEEYVDYLVNKFSLEDFPELHWEEIQMDFGEAQVSGNKLPSEFYVSNPNQVFDKPEVIYHVPISGNQNLLRFGASGVYSSGAIYGTITYNNKDLKLTFVDIYNDPKKVENAFNSTKNTISSKLNQLKIEFTQYNDSLQGLIQAEVDKRMQKIDRSNQYRSKFQYPVKKKNVPIAFEFPRIIKKKKIAPKPATKNDSIKNERFISEDDYMHILGLLQDCGKNWEQHPEIYKGKGEEALRDQLIFVLAPNIEGVVAGEAYNKGGKTDIAIKYESSNLFIGECKIWTGPKGFTGTIDQILGYLTWRDSKAAIMMFVPNKDISKVISSAKETAQNHPNFVRELKQVNEGWINYRFHLINDPGTYLSIAIQLYHLPEL